MMPLFLLSWLLYWGLLVLLPAQIAYFNAAEALLVQLAFVALVLVGYAAFMLAANVGKLPTAERGRVSHARAIVWWSIVLSSLGLAALTYDKIIIQDIDFSHGMAVAREQWRRLGQEREGVSSAFSVLGYLFGNTYFVALVVVVTQSRALANRERLLAIAACLIVALGNSIISGGRSSLLLLAAFAFAAPSIRARVSLLDVMPRVRDRIAFLLLAAVAIGYVLYVTQERADANRYTTEAYVVGSMTTLGLVLDDWYVRTLDGSLLSSISASLVLAGSYITHSFATLAAMVDAPVEDKRIIFIHVLQLASKIGLTEPPDFNWFLSGRFPSLPGALWYQYGTAGLAAGSIALGMLAGAARAWTQRSPHALLPAGFHVCCSVILCLSPLLFAGDLLAFPFIAVAFLLLAGYQRLRDRVAFSITFLKPADRITGTASS